MALSLQSSDDDEDGWLAEINTTPLVDVMLVLLIIFLLTVPVVSASVQLKLPVQSAAVQDTSGDYIIISVDAAGGLYVNENPVESAQALAALIEPLAQRQPRPEIHVRADGSAPYSAVAPVLDMAQGFGFARVGMLTEPGREQPAAQPTRAASGKVAP